MFFPHRASLHEYVMGSETVDPIVSELVSEVRSEVIGHAIALDFDSCNKHMTSDTMRVTFNSFCSELLIFEVAVFCKIIYLNVLNITNYICQIELVVVVVCEHDVVTKCPVDQCK